MILLGRPPGGGDDDAVNIPERREYRVPSRKEFNRAKSHYPVCYNLDFMLPRRILWKLLVATVFLPCLAYALDRQPNADYRARRVALAHKTSGGVVVLFAAVEAEGPNDLYGFRQDNNFYYLTGVNEPGAAVLIAPEVAGEATVKGHPYTEILFLPGRNPSQEKWTGPKLGPENPEAAKLTGFDRVERSTSCATNWCACCRSPAPWSIPIFRGSRRDRLRRRRSSGCAAQMHFPSPLRCRT